MKKYISVILFAVSFGALLYIVPPIVEYLPPVGALSGAVCLAGMVKAVQFGGMIEVSEDE